MRVYTEFAWHSLFAHHLFITPETPDPDFVPEFTVVDAALFQGRSRARRHCVRRRSFWSTSQRRMILIGGTRYAGEIKKSVFTVMNYLLPLRETLPMHCSANVGTRRRRRDLLRPLRHRQDDALVRFAPAADRRRRARLVGRRRLQLRRRMLCESDSALADGRARDLGRDQSLLDRARERGIRRADARTRRRFGGQDREHALRVSARVHSEHRSRRARAGHPKTIIMLTADAFGVLPPISKLTREQAMYHFLSGYTAKVAGTERGVTEPQATFSTCFGAPFMVHHPTVYAQAARQEDRRARGRVLAGEHRLDRRPVRRRQPHVDRAHPRDGQRRDRGPDSRAFETEPFFGLAVPNERAGGSDRGSQSAQRLGGQGRLRRAGAQEIAALLREFQAIRRARLRLGQCGRD